MGFETNPAEAVEKIEEPELTIGRVQLRVAFKKIQRRPPQPTPSFLIERMELTNQNGENVSLLKLLPPDWRMVIEEGLETAHAVGFAREVQIPRFQTQFQKQFEKELKQSSYLEHSYALFEILHEIGHSLHDNRDAKKPQVDKLREEGDCWDYAFKEINQLNDRGFSLGEEYTPSKLEEFANRALQTYKDNQS